MEGKNILNMSRDKKKKKNTGTDNMTGDAMQETCTLIRTSDIKG